MLLRSFVLSLVATVVLFTASPSMAQATKQQRIVDKADITLQAFLADPELEWFRDNAKNAKGFLIYPSTVRAGFIWGGSGGSGVLVGRTGSGWSYPAFYTQGSATLGLQIGLEVSEIILMIMTQRGLDALFSAEVKLGADASIAAGPVGIGAKAQTADVLAFARSKGLYGGINLEGAVITPRSKWNRRYYGRDVRPSEIIRGGSVSNSGADALRRTLSGVDRL